MPKPTIEIRAMSSLGSLKRGSLVVSLGLILGKGFDISKLLYLIILW